MELKKQYRIYGNIGLIFFHSEQSEECYANIKFLKEKESNIMSLLGLAVNLCSTASVNHALKVLGSVSSGSKFMDKVVIPIGSFCVSCYVGDKVAEHVDKQIADAKENLENIKELRKMTKAYDTQFGNSDETVIHNIFEETATKWSEDGRPIAGRYPYKSNNKEEVNENAD